MPYVWHIIDNSAVRRRRRRLQPQSAEQQQACPHFNTYRTLQQRSDTGVTETDRGGTAHKQRYTYYYITAEE